jgi:hypothetical protein
LQGEPKKKKKQLLLASGLAQEVYQNFVVSTGLAEGFKVYQDFVCS